MSFTELLEGDWHIHGGRVDEGEEEQVGSFLNGSCTVIVSDRPPAGKDGGGAPRCCCQCGNRLLDHQPGGGTSLGGELGVCNKGKTYPAHTLEDQQWDLKHISSYS